MTDPTTLAAHDLAHRIASREFTAEEVILAHVNRAATLDALNALAFPAFDRALQEARQRDAALARGEVLGPLHGVPFTVKDWVEAEGLPCAACEVSRRDVIAVRDATVVARLRAAGGIVLGKTSVLASSEAYGEVRNPYGARLSPGGSSSGEAALIAAYGSPLGIGSDSGGSIRQPAGYCGIAGLKPTSGRVPLTGHLPRINPLADPRTVIGPMARSVEDLALAYRLMSGVDDWDASVIPVPLCGHHEVSLTGLRVAFYDTVHSPEGRVECEPDVSSIVRTAALALAAAGCHVREDAPARLEEALPLTRQYWSRPESESWDEWVPSGSSRLSADEVERHLFEWDRFRRTVHAFMRDTDVILTPIAEKAATPHGEPGGGIWFTAPYSLTGYPAVVVRGGTTRDGRPVGVQVVARAWGEHVALAVARHLEDALGGYAPPPAEAVNATGGA